MGRGLIEGQLLRISPISSSGSRARREHNAEHEDLQADCNLGSPDREKSTGEGLESFRAGHGAEMQPVYAKGPPGATFCTASARRQLQERLPSGCSAGQVTHSTASHTALPAKAIANAIALLPSVAASPAALWHSWQ